ncbi:NusA-like transcription termination signal-binding factor, partial [Candidatus Micrarchaeota archaeon]|nr:NusA-like transcription termination signal-binding factor [Candidatus Micrarchaeota archaeon]
MVKLTHDEIKCITAFEELSGAIVKDCILDENSILFLIKEGDMGRAIGKNGSTIERARKAFRKNLYVAEHAEKAEKLIGNLIFPIPVINLNIQD